MFGLPRSATVRSGGGARLTAYTAGAFKHRQEKDRLEALITGPDDPRADV
jgi:hypothetical protein